MEDPCLQASARCLPFLLMSGVTNVTWRAADKDIVILTHEFSFKSWKLEVSVTGQPCFLDELSIWTMNVSRYDMGYEHHAIDLGSPSVFLDNFMARLELIVDMIDNDFLFPENALERSGKSVSWSCLSSWLLQENGLTYDDQDLHAWYNLSNILQICHYSWALILLRSYCRYIIDIPVSFWIELL